MKTGAVVSGCQGNNKHERWKHIMNTMRQHRSSVSLFEAGLRSRSASRSPARVPIDGRGQFKERKTKIMRAVNPVPKPGDRIEKLDDLFTIRNIGVSDSGIMGRVFQHILLGSLFLVLMEMFVYIFLVNAAYATVYWTIGGCCGEGTRFWDDFNFAFQTYTTIGYGELAPEGVLANIIVFFQGMHSIVSTTILAGVVFTKFLRPRWKFLFSDVVVIHNHDDYPTLCVRFGNVDGEFNNLLNVNASVFLGRFENSIQGVRFRRNYILNLVADMRFEVRGVWSVQHRIDEDSPLKGRTFEDMIESKASVHVSISGIDPVTEETVTKHAMYLPSHILFGYRFEDQTSWNAEKRILTFDYSKLSSVIPADVSYPIVDPKRKDRRVKPDDFMEGIIPDPRKKLNPLSIDVGDKAIRRAPVDSAAPTGAAGRFSIAFSQDNTPRIPTIADEEEEDKDGPGPGPNEMKTLRPAKNYSYGAIEQQ
ncbi:hypothetical protein AAMO2058_000527500 [Amorphochlora amoebiformis]